MEITSSSVDLDLKNHTLTATGPVDIKFRETTNHTPDAGTVEAAPHENDSANLIYDWRTSPFRDTAKYLSPFTAVHFDTNDINKVVVVYNGSEYGLTAIDDLPVADTLDFCRRHYGKPPQVEEWAQKRFAEDLVIVLADMKHPVKADNTVGLTLSDPHTGQQKVIAHAGMTEKNRKTVLHDRALVNSNLLQSVLQK